MEFKPITLKDKALFDHYLKEFPPAISEFTFTNLFVWKKEYEFTIIEDHLLISFDEKKKFYQPIGKYPEKIIKEVLKEFPGARFERVEEEIAKKTGLAIEEQRDMADYVYDIKELIELKGNDYEPKRNQIKQAEKYKPEVCRLDKESIPGFLKLQEKWCDIRKCEENKETKAEDIAIKEAIKNCDILNIHGTCISINGKIEAFAIGEKLNNDTFVEHFEKANTEFKGIYQYLLREFAKSIPKEFKFLNREQDLGIAGLRKAKLSYKPIRLEKKFTVS